MAAIELELAGWLGAILLLLAYLLLTKGKIKVGLTYQLMNFLGSILVGINSFLNMAYPSVVINILWIFVTLYGIEKAFRKAKNPRILHKLLSHL